MPRARSVPSAESASSAGSAPHIAKQKVGDSAWMSGPHMGASAREESDTCTTHRRMKAAVARTMLLTGTWDQHSLCQNSMHISSKCIRTAQSRAGAKANGLPAAFCRPRLRRRATGSGRGLRRSRLVEKKKKKNQDIAPDEDDGEMLP